MLLSTSVYMEMTDMSLYWTTHVTRAGRLCLGISSEHVKQTDPGVELIQCVTVCVLLLLLFILLVLLLFLHFCCCYSFSFIPFSFCYSSWCFCCSFSSSSSLIGLFLGCSQWAILQHGFRGSPREQAKFNKSWIRNHPVCNPMLFFVINLSPTVILHDQNEHSLWDQ